MTLIILVETVRLQGHVDRAKFPPNVTDCSFPIWRSNPGLPLFTFGFMSLSWFPYLSVGVSLFFVFSSSCVCVNSYVGSWFFSWSASGHHPGSSCFLSIKQIGFSTALPYSSSWWVLANSREGNGTLPQYSCLENPMDGGAWWAAVYWVAKSRTGLSDFTFTFHFHALEKEMATHSSVLAWRIPGMGEPGGLLSMRSHRVRPDWSDLAAAAANARSNQSIIKKINPPYSLEGLKLKLQYFGHLMCRADSLEKTLMLGKIEGRRRKRWQRMLMLDGIPTWWTWVWANSRRDVEGQGRLACYSSWGWWRVRHDLASEQQQANARL